jgi:argininosuccinate lyase
MPQKKNPDVPELARGKTGRVNGNLVSLLTLMKGQALAYNKDNQEDKEPLFDSADTLIDTLRIFADMVPHISFNEQAMRLAVQKGFATATDLADYLVKKGMPFRDAHEAVANAVKVCVNKNIDLSELSLEELMAACHVTDSDMMNKDVFKVLTLEGSIEGRNHIGGTAPIRVLEAIEKVQLSIRNES